MYISAEEDLITPERYAKGDLEVATNLKKKISRAVPMNLTIIKELIFKDVFPFHYEIYGVGFLELQASFRAPWRVRNSVALLEKEALEQLGIAVSTSKASEMYQHVCKQLGKYKIDMLQFMMEYSENRKKMDKEYKGNERRRNRQDEYKNCFEHLVGIMDAERERIFNEIN